MNKLKRKALLLIANNMAPEEVAGLRAIFQVRKPQRCGLPACARIHHLHDGGAPRTSDRSRCSLRRRKGGLKHRRAGFSSRHAGTANPEARRLDDNPVDSTLL